MNTNNDLQEYAIGNEAKVILAGVMTKYLAPETVRYICNDFLHELMVAKAEALLGAKEEWRDPK